MRNGQSDGVGPAQSSTPTAGFRIQRLNHAVLYVSDLERAVSFYSEVLGFEPTSKIAAANAVFLRSPGSLNHHDLGLFGLGPGSQQPTKAHTGLYHLAWQVATIDELVEARATLLAAGALVGESSHGATKSLYARDPDNNEFEVMWMLPREDWGPYEHDAVVERLDLVAEVERWSGVATTWQGPAT